jgi:hypothetical protein
MGRNDIKENEWLMTEKCNTPTRPITLHGAWNIFRTSTF